MTKEEVISYIAGKLWFSGIASKKLAPSLATEIVETLIAKGVLKVSE